MTNRYDVVYASNTELTIEPHFCRSWDESGGCYGTNPDHGLSFEEARAEVRDHYRDLAYEWSVLSEEEWRRDNLTWPEETDDD